MNPAEFRRELERRWAELDSEAMSRKDSSGALFEFMKLYERLNAQERRLADQAIAEWIQSTNVRKQFDALALVDRFRIQAAAHQIMVLEAQLESRTGPEARYELAKVRRILERLKRKP